MGTVRHFLLKYASLVPIILTITYFTETIQLFRGSETLSIVTYVYRAKNLRGHLRALRLNLFPSPLLSAPR